MTQKPKNPITNFFFRRAVLHDHAASRQVKIEFSNLCSKQVKPGFTNYQPRGLTTI